MTSGHGDNANLYQRAKRLIPGGTQLLSKRPELYAPDVWPAYYREANGCEIIDLDGRRLVDMTTNGIGACLLGYADPDVNAAVIRQIENGAMCTLNPPQEVELAELLVDLHPWSDQVRFARTGGESMAVAVRIARAATRRDVVAFCGYHGWSDWYLAANLARGDELSEHLLSGLEPRGVPRGLAETAIPFRYNRLDELDAIIRNHGTALAAIVMEPTRSADPSPGFLEGVRQRCDDCGAVLVMDEISIGWRLVLGGAHLRYGINPDIAVFAKTISNGHPMGAVLGKADVMQAAQESFISSAYWTEAVGPAAALATIRKMQRIDIPAHVAMIGRKTMDRWIELGSNHGVPIAVSGHPAMVHLDFDCQDNAALGTLFTVRMLDEGFLAGARFYPTLAHTEQHVESFANAADRVFPEIAAAARDGNVHDRLKTPVRHSGFERLT
jgi:glutamate-1-semialdehyde 2,1-aminomutase